MTLFLSLIISFLLFSFNSGLKKNDLSFFIFKVLLLWIPFSVAVFLQNNFYFESEYLTLKTLLFLQIFINCVQTTRLFLNWYQVSFYGVFGLLYFLLLGITVVLNFFFSLSIFNLSYCVYKATDDTQVLTSNFFWTLYWVPDTAYLIQKFENADLDVDSCLKEFDPTKSSISSFVSFKIQQEEEMFRQLEAKAKRQFFIELAVMLGLAGPLLYYLFFV